MIEKARHVESTAPGKRVVAASYTRKSTTHGLDSALSSIDVQRQRCEDFIRTQSSNGWEICPERFDDGGFSGANVERPALKRLLQRIEEGAVQAIVVFILDRLSRSIIDKSQLLAMFDRHGVAFASATEPFNTASSTGRLMLHIVASFAEFERSVIAERTREKAGAARRKGLWIGGTPVYGLDVHPDGGKLIPNPIEAERVREIYKIYLAKQSLIATAAEINRRGWRTKAYSRKDGQKREAKPFDKCRLSRLLGNPLYCGRIRHKGEILPGAHEAIVDEEVWRKAQELLRSNGQRSGSFVRNKHDILLKGLVRCAPCDAPMTYSYAIRRGKHYGSLRCLSAIRRGAAACPSGSIAVGELDRFVIDRIRAVGKDPVLHGEVLTRARAQMAASVAELEAEVARAEKAIATQKSRLVRLEQGRDRARRLATEVAKEKEDLRDRISAGEAELVGLKERLAAARADGLDEQEIVAALNGFDDLWAALYPAEQRRVLRLLVERVVFDGRDDSLAITFRPAGLRQFAAEMGITAEGSGA